MLLLLILLQVKYLPENTVHDIITLWTIDSIKSNFSLPYYLQTLIHLSYTTYIKTYEKQNRQLGQSKGQHQDPMCRASFMTFPKKFYLHIMRSIAGIYLQLATYQTETVLLTTKPINTMCICHAKK